MTREEAIDLLDNLNGMIEDSRNSDYDTAFKMAIKALEQEPRWTPISEGLPNKDKYTDFYKCLVAVRYTSRHDICDSITAYYDGKHFYANRYDTISIPGVKAWMPLPEPYKAESENEK